MAGIPFGLLELVWRSGLKIAGMSVSQWQSVLGLVAFPMALIAIMILMPRYEAVLARRVPSKRLSRHGHLAMLGLPGVVAIDVGLMLGAMGGAPALIVQVLSVCLLCWPAVYSVVWGAMVWRRCATRTARGRSGQ